MKLQPKQKAFADYYIESGNVYESAIRAGYSKNYAKAQSFKLLDNVGIATYIQERIKSIEDERIAKGDEVLKYLTSVMRGESESEVIIVENTMGSSKSKRVMKKPDEKERLKAAELLGKRYRLFTEKVEVKDEGKERTEKSISSIEAMLEQMVDVNEGDIDA